MKEELITFKTAKLAKEKGFDEEVLLGYNKKENVYKCHYSYVKNTLKTIK